MIDVALVGCGKAGENHIRELRTLPRARLVAVCDSEPLMAAQLAARYQVPRSYSNIAQLLERERPTVVHIATPPQSHLSLALLALDAGCHVLVEKPLAMCHGDAELMIERTVRHNRKLTIGYGFYFDPISRAMRDLVDDGTLGDPVHVESFMGYALNGQFGVPVLADTNHWVHGLPGKLVHNVIDHLLYHVTEFVRDDAPRITAQALRRTRGGNPALALPDELRVMIAGAEVTGYSTFSAHARPLAHTLTVYGTRNTIVLDFVGGSLTMRSTPSLPGPFGRLSCALDQSWQHLRSSGRNVRRMMRGDFHTMAGLRHLIHEFHECVRRDSAPPISYPDILRVSSVIDRVIAQLEPRSLHDA